MTDGDINRIGRQWGEWLSIDKMAAMFSVAAEIIVEEMRVGRVTYRTMPDGDRLVETREAHRWFGQYTTLVQRGAPKQPPTVAPEAPTPTGYRWNVPDEQGTVPLPPVVDPVTGKRNLPRLKQMDSVLSDASVVRWARKMETETAERRALRASIKALLARRGLS